MLHYFNPGHEYAVLNREPSYTPPTNMTKMGDDLRYLPLWYANENDSVLVDSCEGEKYYKVIKEQGVLLPQITTKEKLKDVRDAEVCMWGITPATIRYFEHINRTYNVCLKLPEWKDEFIALTSRMTSCDFLASILNSSDYFSFLQLPIFYSDIEEIQRRVIASESVLLAKAPFSSSGKGLLWLPPGELKRSEKQILQGILNKQKEVSIEPVYNKILDFAMEFMSDGEGRTSFEGYSVFETSEKGNYTGNILESQERLEQKLFGYIAQGVVEEVKAILIDKLSESYGLLYKGCIGVDMMIINVDGEYKLHPCVEINMRYNMGFLAIQLMKKVISPISKGRFYIDFNKSGVLGVHQEMNSKCPPVFEKGRLKFGYLSLCPIGEDTKYRAYVLIEES